MSQEYSCITNERLPRYIICSNADVLEIRSSRKILKYPETQFMSSEFKFLKVMLFSQINSYEDMMREDTIEQYFDELVDRDLPYHSVTNPRLVEMNER